MILAAALAMAAAPESTLTIRVENVRNAEGVVHMDVCPKAQFLKDDCPWSGDAPAHPGETIVVVHGVPPGDYAVQGFHDENVNHKVDRALFGAIPKEGDRLLKRRADPVGPAEMGRCGVCGRWRQADHQR